MQTTHFSFLGIFSFVKILSFFGWSEKLPEFLAGEDDGFGYFIIVLVCWWERSGVGMNGPLRFWGVLFGPCVFVVGLF